MSVQKKIIIIYKVFFPLLRAPIIPLNQKRSFMQYYSQILDNQYILKGQYTIFFFSRSDTILSFGVRSKIYIYEFVSSRRSAWRNAQSLRMIQITLAEMLNVRLMVNWVKFTPCWAIMSKLFHAWNTSYKMQSKSKTFFCIIVLFYKR